MMIQQHVILIEDTGKQKIDLVKGFKTKARIYRVDWFIRQTDWTQDFAIAAAIDAIDYETAIAPTSDSDLMNRSLRVISQFGVHNQIETSGMTSTILTHADPLVRPMDIVCPISALCYEADGGVSIYCRIYYDILTASRDEIIEIAAEQGLNMEV